MIEESNLWKASPVPLLFLSCLIRHRADGVEQGMDGTKTCVLLYTTVEMLIIGQLYTA